MNIVNTVQNGFSARLFAGVTIVSLLLTAFPVAFFVAQAATQNVNISVAMIPNPSTGNDLIKLTNPESYPVTIEQLQINDLAVSALFGPADLTIAANGLETIEVSNRLNAAADDVTFSGTNVTSATVSYTSAPPTDGAVPGSFQVAADDGTGVGLVENTDTGETFATVQAAIDDADTDNGDTIVMSADETTTAQITVNKEITLDGGGFTIDAAFTKTDNSNNAAIGIIGTDNVTVTNIVLDGASGTDLHGLNIYESTGITVENVESKNFRSGMVVNGSTVDASDFSTEGNIWHGINVAPGLGVTDPSVLNISNTSMHGEVAPVPHIFTDNINAGPTITVNDVDDQYDVFDIPAAPVTVSLSSALVSNQGPVARAYFLKQEEPKKVDICHFHQNGFNAINVSVNSIENAHGDDTEDIIPVIPEIYPNGQNLDTLYGAVTGAEVLANGCVVPLPPSNCIDVNLLTNGSFEEPEVTNTKKWQKMSAVPGWTVTKVSDNTPTTLELMENIFGNQAADGDQYVELDGDHSTKVTQTVSGLDLRAKYELSWAFAGRHGIAPAHNQLDVIIDGSSVTTEGPQTDPKGLAFYDWTRNSYTFTAMDDEVEIAFTDLGPSNSYGTYLDDAVLCLVAEPEPAPEVCSYAGTVVSADQGLTNGGAAVAADRSLVSAVEAGKAPYTNFFGKEGNDWQVSPLDFYSLGIGGELVYEFTDKIAVDQAGADIAIWEITGGNPSQQATESVDVYLSSDGVNFEMADSVTGDGTVDIANTSLTFVKFVKLVDTSQGVQGNSGDGYDLDAITIIEGSCDDYVTISTSKIVCDYEEELPNWGGGAADITETTAADWLTANPETSCRLIDGWEFEWAERSAENPGDAHVGYGGSDWSAFSGSTMIPLSLVDGKSFWMREVLQLDYTPFSGANREKDVSAEMYCHKDVLNYDNFDRVDGPKAGGEYHCVAWNVPTAPSCELEIKSNTSTLVIENNQYAVEAYVHSNWTDEIDATWVWATEEVENPEDDETYTFKETFIVNDVTDAVIEIAADNGYIFTVNGTEVADRSDMNNYGDLAVKSFDIASLLIDGENMFTIMVNNEGKDDASYKTNPAGVLYKMVVNAGTDCVVTTEPTDYFFGYKYNDENGNGELDEDEVGISGWEITATEGEGAYEPVVVFTDEFGFYEFNLPAGEWSITEEDREGWTLTAIYQNGELVTVEQSGAQCSFDTTEGEFSEQEIEGYYFGGEYECDFLNHEDEEVDPTPTTTSGGSSGTRTNRSLPQAPVGEVLGASTDTCPFLTEFMQMGVDNNPMEVMKLQLFLNIFKDVYGGTDNPVTGNFGIITDTNVKAFQTHFRSEVLEPWFNEGIVGHTKPTGFVYKTTVWKINDLICGDVFPSLEGETLETNVDLNANAIQD